MKDILLQARNLTKEFPAGGSKKIKAVSDVTIRLYKGETLGLIGSSGSGKSTLGRLLIRLIEPQEGEIFWQTVPVSSLSEQEFAQYRRQFQLIFRNPRAALDPRMTVRDLIAEPLSTYRLCPTKETTTRRVMELMGEVGLPEELLYCRPDQASDCQCQRIGIARAISGDPSLIVCDDPVSELDVSDRKQILDLLKKLQDERGLAYLFISEDPLVIRHISDRVSVMLLGKICETGPAADIFTDPKHPYTRALVNSLLLPDPAMRNEEKELISGDLPDLIDPPSGCRFHTACPYATMVCSGDEPEMQKAGERETACHHVTLNMEL